jgi:pimeloyl-ACP methyl ester carboxylesterase
MKELRAERRLREAVEQIGGRWERSTYARTGGYTVAHRIAPPDEPRGVVLVAHGAGNDALFAFTPLFRRLLHLRLEIFTFDLDGHGRESTSVLSPAEVGSSLIAAAGWSEARARDLPLHLLGISFGGALALASAPTISPTTLTVIATPLEIDPGWRSVLRELGVASLRTLWRERRDHGLTGLIPAFGPFLRSRFPVRVNGSAGSPFGYMEALRDSMRALQPLERARDISAPTLLIYGERDLTAPPADGKRIAGEIRGSRLQLLPGETHLSTPLAPRTLDAVADWLQLHDRQRSGAQFPSSSTDGR